VNELFAPIFVPDELRDATSGFAWLRAMLDAERALAAARGVEENGGEGDAYDPSAYDIAAIAREGRRVGNPVEPLVRALRERVPDAHTGATSQDILDTAAMLVARDVRVLVVRDLERAAAACARFADEQRATVMAARTLMQQAVPTTFGLKAAGWLVGLLDARKRFLAWQPTAQLGGAAGTLSLLGHDGLRLVAAYARALGLAEPLLPWHASRGPVRELVAALDGASAACGKIALDVVLLAQTEVGEARVPGTGGSSTMPHKRNPVGPVLAQACVRRARALATTFTWEHEHERAAGAWHAEWDALSDLLALTGGAARQLRETLDGLEIDAARMRANLIAEATSEGGANVAPEDYLGSASALVDRALARYREES
jgi:3-carboxy-cis,cis-muconate cycloisomerase